MASTGATAQVLGLVALVLLLSLSCVQSFYLPGVSPKDYEKEAKVNLYVNKMDSAVTQIPYEYYSLKFCPPPDRPHDDAQEDESIGQAIVGDVIERSNYDLRMQKTVDCKILCEMTYDIDDIDEFAMRIREEYRVHWIVDNLPAATPSYITVGGKKTATYERGYPLGFIGRPRGLGEQENNAYLYNHIRMTILYHEDAAYIGARIVGFEVYPYSINHKYAGEWEGQNTQLEACGSDRPLPDTPEQGPQPMDRSQESKKVVYTYDVHWKKSDIRWASRWDLYLEMHAEESIHWFSIINSLLIVLFLSGMVAMIMMRTLHKDFLRYERLETSEDAQEESGWKLVHGDVFRPPANPGLFASCVGTGVQVSGMTCVLMVFAVLGFLSPAHRGGLMTAMLLLFVFMGIFAGYISSRIYKMFRGAEWKRNTMLTAFMFPAVIFTIYFCLDCVLWSQGSSAAVPFVTMASIFVLWFGISVPLVFIGSYFGFSKAAIEHPTRTNQIPRQIPDQMWYMQAPFTILIGGILPFGAVFIELFFILSSIWLHQYYYVFGFLFLVFAILIVMCCEITIVMCYFQLCSEDYHWWWRSFLTSGSSAVYLFLYSIVYFSSNLHIHTFVSGLLYFGYMLIISGFFFFFTGVVGFCSCFVFVTAIYGSIKVD
eukprot:GFYU01000911.1.p1 GENE.GFYU01000911.1~~GFYU01000911.1.p1  ORF type:complete len:654 (+),score=184.51 GFYU01000911.1:132-2093(+)